MYHSYKIFDIDNWCQLKSHAKLNEKYNPIIILHCLSSVLPQKVKVVIIVFFILLI